jgi:curli biogenesis system outer membrane secretion channel CsgG
MSLFNTNFSIYRAVGFLFLAALYLCLLSGCVHEPRISVSTDANAFNVINHVYVLDFTDAPGAEAGNSGTVVANAVVVELLNIPGITLIERKKIKAILEEHRLNMSGLIDEKQAIKLGKLLGANAVVFGSVSQYNTSTIPMFLGLFTYYMDLYNVAANLRIVNVESGEIVFSGGNSANSSKSYQDASSKVAQSLIVEFQKVFKR